MLIYMDCCCLNRPSDDQTQDKIRIESDAIIAILFKCYYGSWRKWKMINQVLAKDMNSIRKLGIDALTEKLGPIGMIEFVRQFDSGYGDYTKERHNWLDCLTIENIDNEIKSMKESNGV